MQTRIHELNHANNAHHATGPKCLQKFLRAKDNVAVRKSLQVLSCNNCAAANRLGVYAKDKYDVISYKSDLDYGERHPSHTSGGHVDDVPKLAAALTEHRRKTLSEAAHPHPARRLRTKSSAAIMTTVSSAHMEMKKSTNSFFVSADCCEEAQQRAAILLQDQSEVDREWTLQMDAWTKRWLAGNMDRQEKQYQYDAILRAKRIQVHNVCGHCEREAARSEG